MAAILEDSSRMQLPSVIWLTNKAKIHKLQKLQNYPKGMMYTRMKDRDYQTKIFWLLISNNF